MHIRDYDDADWDSFWPIFREITAAQETYPYDPNWTSEQAKDVWTSPDHVVVAEEDGAVLGSAGMGANRPGPGAHVATASFMVGSAARGRGVGRALGEYVVGWARELGYAAMQFNAVVETNDAAVHLWQDLGFEIIGTVPEAYEHARHGRVGLHVMYRRL
ncbi:GNAT family N-acetyltransferase [Solicola gregarius]|uniref:GNAT family N-acetyltransferase n=1 Tax=Solicola gregarius TaxID=2908642 RepID=A0AA46TGV6_9ACTN|nr:GNAT family N-acetyltransferase [Solicola gregarius]UYM05124.1 GNAT family N-acetyltransferase [Solicola gregarius]